LERTAQDVERITAAMTKVGRIVLGVFAALCVGSAIAYLIGERVVGNWLMAAPLVLSGWAAMGHLVTIDDDMPGGWSNPRRSGTLLLRSLGELVLKVLVFVVLFWLFLSQQ
jgi:hypothetical protein